MSDFKEGFRNNPRLSMHEAYILKFQEEGIDIDKYRQYHNVMRENDISIVNKISIIKNALDIRDINLIGAKEIIDDAFNAWRTVQEKYQKINLERLNSDTGKEIIEKMKSLVDSYMTELQEYKILNDSMADVPDMPESLKKILDQIIELAKEYATLPAYKVYRAYEALDSDRATNA